MLESNNYNFTKLLVFPLSHSKHSRHFFFQYSENTSSSMNRFFDLLKVKKDLSIIASSIRSPPRIPRSFHKFPFSRQILPKGLTLIEFEIFSSSFVSLEKIESFQFSFHSTNILPIDKMNKFDDCLYQLYID